MMRLALLAALLPAAAMALEQTTIDAARLDVDDPAGTATFSGDVVVVQPQLTLTAPKLVVEYSRKSGGPKGGMEGISRMTASGGVTITRKGADVPEVAKGQNAVYQPASHLLVMTGAVTLTHGQNILNGDRLEYDMTTGKVNVTSQSRVHANFGGDAPAPGK